MKETPIKVALVGCGQIADAHLQEIRKIAGARLVAVCDRYIDLARQAAQRYEVPHAFDDLERMIETAKPDVLHVTTPPQTHCAIALQALSAGVHVYVEKPFAIDAAEAQSMVDAAAAARRLVCVGHDQLFDPLWLELRRRHDEGALGRVVHIDSIQGYDLGGPFGKAFASDPRHWIHRLPGSFFQNTISHALYKITEFLPDERPAVHACWFGEEGPANCPTELRVCLAGLQTTAYLTSSCAARPVQRVARICGTRATAEIDFDGDFLSVQTRLALRGPFARLEYPYRRLRQSAAGLRRNLTRFLRNRLHYFGGMNALFSAFYRAVREGREAPIAYGEIVRVTAIMDEIFEVCRRRRMLPLTPLLEPHLPTVGAAR
jgi:predicted dehydrogenase